MLLMFNIEIIKIKTFSMTMFNFFKFFLANKLVSQQKLHSYKSQSCNFRLKKLNKKNGIH